MTGDRQVQPSLSWQDLDLPPCPEPPGNFLPYTRSGGLVLLSGQTCKRGGRMLHTGQLGESVTPAEAREAARVCMLNLLAALGEAVDRDWSRVRRCLRLTGYVNCAPGQPVVPEIIDGASDLVVALMGEAGRHARTSIGVASLPGNAAVEVEAIFEIGDDS